MTQVPERPPVLGGNRRVECVDQAPPRRRDLRAHHPPVTNLAHTVNEARRFHPIEEACDVGHPGQQAVSQLVSAEPLLSCPTQDAQHVVLRERDPRGLDRLLQPVGQHRRGADEIQVGLLREAVERQALPNLVAEGLSHRGQYPCCNTLCQDTDATGTPRRMTPGRRARSVGRARAEYFGAPALRPACDAARLPHPDFRMRAFVPPTVAAVARRAVLCVFLAAVRALPAQSIPAQRTRPATPRPITLAQRLGYPADAKLLILHGDDLGVAHSVDVATLDALERGVLSSASVMMPCPWVTEVAAWARAHPDHDLGLHLTLTSEWESYRWGTVAPATEVATLLDSTGTLARDTPPVAEHAAVAEVERELRAQVERALALGLRPTHLDSHMGALFTTPALFATLVRVAHAYHLPFLTARGVARSGAGGLPPDVRVDRDVVVDTVVTAGADVPRERWKAFYLDAVRGLRPGLTEMIVHLGHDDAELQAVTVHHEPWGAAWRQRDNDVLRSPEFRQALKDNGVVLVRWRDLQRVAAQP